MIVAFRPREWVLLFYLFLPLKAEVGISTLAIVTIISQPQSALLALRVEFLVLALFFKCFSGFIVRDVDYF